MRTSHFWLFVCLASIVSARPQTASADEAGGKATVWEINQLDSIGGHKLTILGSPRVINTPQGKAVEFDGKGDGIFIDANPVAGLQQFTAEVVFKPYAEGPTEQRFLHFQERGDTEDRLLFETRLTGDGHWFLDTFIKSGEGNHTLKAEKALHKIGPWYHAAVTMDGKTMRHYVNGVEELSAETNFKPQGKGQTSIGVRLNKVFWYKGAIRQVRITPKVLSAKEFLKAD